ncbi:hypothetical protein PMNALOAF_3851 [Methylobacterium adhaesivum]|uniref:Uncharacterized protein n=1 Tax=Methylobacterium adhaesivum TaxID=333297 RepID=A0ABT8BJA3_9HYPH|nr:hypothetical protein [Methylobacterium adhaesivum]MDN3592171.1 hypothetical protein [Methylobacterium adhaesivum]GJD32574.1 hypothetical protein PMNALOAF_3851 [Methylobacterium adhaesivum]
MIVDVLNCINDTDAETDEGAAHAALFAHVGVTDAEDWRTVALRLACQYAPELLTGLESCESAKPARKGGRPKTRTDWHLMMVEIFVEQVREASREKRIRPGLDTDIDACKYILGTAPETKDMRDALGLKPGTSPFTLNNMLRDARKLGKRA